MERDIISAEKKIENLLRFTKHAGIRNPVTLGIIFNLWNVPELLDASVFLADPAAVSQEPLLFIGHDNCPVPTKLQIGNLVIENLDDIWGELQNLKAFYIYVSFPNNMTPSWHLNICQTIGSDRNTTIAVWQSPKMSEPFKSIYKQALLILIDGALDCGDRDSFMVLTEEWNKIA